MGARVNYWMREENIICDCGNPDCIGTIFARRQWREFHDRQQQPEVRGNDTT